MASNNKGVAPALNDGLLVLCCGGHSRSVVSVAVEINITQIVIVDPNARPNEEVLGFPIKATVPTECSSWQFICASGDNNLRRANTAFYARKGHEAVTIVAQTATVCSSSHLGRGVFVGHGAHVGPEATVGDGCIVNTSAVVEHGATVNAFSHVSVNSTLCGKARLGQDCLLGANSTVIDGIKVCDNVVIGAGATVVRDIDHPGTYIGSPANLYPERVG